MSRPLVYAAERVLERSAPLLPSGVILENEVAKAIERGNVEVGSGGGYVFLDQFGLVARVKRRPGKRRPRPRAWFVTALVANKNVDRRRNHRAHKAA